MKTWLRKLLPRKLAWKLFVSYLVVIFIGIFSLTVAIEFVIPSAFNRHMLGMEMMGEGQGLHNMMGQGGNQNRGVFQNFKTAVNEALIISALVAIPTAGVASFVISRRLVAPVRQMMGVTQRIAAGNYDERVSLPPDFQAEDLDEFESLALSFNQMASNLARTEERRRQLIGDVAHELRTPLTTIKGYMEGLVDGVMPANSDTYQEVSREADRLQRLVADLQELSRVEAGVYPIDKSPVDIASVIGSVINHMDSQFKEKDVVLEFVVPEFLPNVIADEDRLFQVLNNLVSNALQYTQPGGYVHIAVKKRNNHAEVTVADDGIGIPPEHLPHIFSRFYRVDKSRSRVGGGSGIGLTITKHLVEAQGGHIRAESDGPGKGSRFIFSLPMQRLPIG